MKWSAILFAIFVGMIVVLADAGVLNPALNFINSIPFGDKLGHFILIGTLTFLIVGTMIQTNPSLDPKLVAGRTALAIAVFFSLEEFSQNFFPSRHPDIRDLLANFMGILCFGLASYYLSRKRAVQTSASK